MNPHRPGGGKAEGGVGRPALGRLHDLPSGSQGPISESQSASLRRLFHHALTHFMDRQTFAELVDALTDGGER